MSDAREMRVVYSESEKEKETVAQAAMRALVCLPEYLSSRVLLSSSLPSVSSTSQRQADGRSDQALCQMLQQYCFVGQPGIQTAAS